jgi:hypothetical protein
MLPVVTLKVADVAPAATVTDAGVLSAVLESVKVTTAPPAGAAAVRVTVQVPDAFAPILLGLHVTVDTNAVAVVAVTVRLVDPLIAPEVA